MKYLCMRAVFAALLAGCASSDIASEASDPISSASIIAPWGEADKYWVNVNRVAPEYPRFQQQRGINGCVNIAYIIGEDGRAHSPRVVADYPANSRAFREASLEALAKFRYEPSEENPERKRIITNFVTTFFLSSDSVSEAKMEESERTLSMACDVGQITWSKQSCAMPGADCPISWVTPSAAHSSATEQTQVVRTRPLASLTEYGLDQSVNHRASRWQRKVAKENGIEIPFGNYLPKKKVAPRYPWKAQRQGQAGWVLVAYTVTFDGGTSDVRIVDEYPPGIFGESALEATKEFEFEPYYEGGGPAEIPNAWNLFTYQTR